MTEKKKEKKIKLPSLLIVYTGHGKGKSTAAMGMAFRAMGWGRKVSFVQFIKGKWKTGERQMSDQMPLLNWVVTGTGFTWLENDPDVPKLAAQKGWQQAKELILGGEYPLVILDEFTYPINYGYLDKDDIAATLKARPKDVTVVITGRDAPELVTQPADLVSEMTLIKHPFRDQNAGAVRGVDF